MSKFAFLTTDWFPKKTNLLLGRMTATEYKMVDDQIAQFFDAHLRDQSKVSVPINCPHPWPTALVPVWIAANRDEQEAAMLLGNLYCRHAIKRPEIWISVPYAVLDWKPRLYVYAAQFGLEPPKEEAKG
jgi:hypothetical protein